MPDVTLAIKPVPNAVDKNPGTFVYQRRFSVKNLYGAKDALQSFMILTFDSIDGFVAFVQKGFNEKNPTKEYIIKYSSAIELQLILKLISQTSIINDVMVTLQPVTDEALTAATTLLNETFSHLAISLTPAEALRLTSLMRKDLTLPIHKFLLPRDGPGNWGWIRTIWKADSYFNEYEDLVEAAIANPFFRAIDLQIDYASFEEAPIKELHRLFFYYQSLRIWEETASFSVSNNPFGIDLPKKEKETSESKGPCQCSGTTSCSDSPPINTRQQGIIFKYRQSPLRAFVHDNLDLSLDSLGTFDFPLSEHLEDDGETLPLDLINTLREILDVRFAHIPNIQNTGEINLYLIDVAQNIRIMKDPYMVPYLTRIILDWTYPRATPRTKGAKYE